MSPRVRWMARHSINVGKLDEDDGPPLLAEPWIAYKGEFAVALHTEALRAFGIDRDAALMSLATKLRIRPWD